LGVQKHEKNGSSQKMRLFSSIFFLPRLFLFCSIFFNRVFGRFVTRGVQKRHKKNRAKISSASKKSTYLLTSLFFVFDGPPWPAQSPPPRVRVRDAPLPRSHNALAVPRFSRFFCHTFGCFSGFKNTANNSLGENIWACDALTYPRATGSPVFCGPLVLSDHRQMQVARGEFRAPAERMRMGSPSTSQPRY
jgi:hypothetical protein